MELTGSLTEQCVREELTATQQWFVSHPQFGQIINAIKEYVPNPKSAMALYWFPDNGEHVINILVNGEHLVTVEVDQQVRNPPKVLNHKTIEPTNHGLKRQDQIRLSVALTVKSEAKI